MIEGLGPVNRLRILALVSVFSHFLTDVKCCPSREEMESTVNLSWL